jgi:hypothetical protein
MVQLVTVALWRRAPNERHQLAAQWPQRQSLEPCELEEPARRQLPRHARVPYREGAEAAGGEGGGAAASAPRGSPQAGPHARVVCSGGRTKHIDVRFKHAAKSIRKGVYIASARNFADILTKPG